MQKSSFFNSINGDRKYNASDYAAYFGSFIGNGVYPNPGNNLAVTASGGMNISVAAGKAWINGYYYENTGTFNMSIDPADGVLKRIDRIVLRLDHLNRQIVLSVLKGTPASTPTASLLTRTSDIYELGIADILINNGDTAILQENITDQRLNSDLCGIVHGTVEQVDTSEIFNQYQAALDSFKKEKSEDFTTWVDNLKDILDESTAGNLLNLINNNTSYLNTHLSETATNAHRASNISITDAEGRFTATNVESALNELFTSANDGKTAVATAITAKGVDASPTDTFPILATKIGQITTGKRVITTTLTVASTQKNFYIQNVSTAQASWYVIYNGSIPFEPSRIVLSNRGTLSPTADPNYPLWVVYDKNGVTDAAGPDYIKILTVYLSSNGFGTWASSGQVFRLEGEAYVNGLGFCLPLRASSSTPSFAGKIMDCTIYE